MSNGYNPNRHLAGSEGGIGGQFATGDSLKDEAGQLFDRADPNARSERAQALNNEGYVPAVASRTKLDPSRISEDERKLWWGGNFTNAEYNSEDGSYPQMPDDYTPKQTLGRALSGHRRTHRMKYEGVDTTLRMPSATSVKSFAKENNGTFDVPVSIETPNGTMNGWVRVTKGANGAYSTNAMGFGDSEHYVSESVRTVLEARHPSVALRDAGPILERYRSRTAMEGVPAEERQSFIKGIGYDENTKTMFVGMGGTTKSGEEKTYAYSDVEPEDYREVAAAESVGRAYNKVIKSGGFASERASQCPQCARFTSPNSAHVCPPAATPRVAGSIAHNEAAEARAKALLSGGAEKGAAPQRPAAEVATDPNKPDMVEWGREAWRASAKSGRLDKSKLHDFGPSVKRGFTMNPEVAGAIQKFTDKGHVPGEFREASNGKVGYSNGDTGIMKFSGLDSSAAASVKANLPAENLAMRATAGAPRVGTILDAVEKSGGKMEAHGWVVPPNRTDEQVAVNGVIVYDDTDNPLMVKLTAMREGINERGMTPPAECRQVEVPHRPGEKAWLLSW